MKDQSRLEQIYTSFDEVTKAYNQARGDLIKMGVLWRDSRLDNVQCFYEPIAPICAVSGTLGYFNEEERNIHFPSLFLPLGWLRGRRYVKNIPLDVLRHEFGHALATLYPQALSTGGLFKRAFGGIYSPQPAKKRGVVDWEERYVSEYAMRDTREDFAETFMLFLKHKGKLPKKFANKPAIAKKWAAVAEIVKRVRALEN